MPLISAIIPVYRDSARASATVDALRRCLLPPGHALEIVVVDDGSGDGTAERLAEHGGERIRLLVNEHNLGRAATRNRGAAAAAGDWLLFLDGDCVPADAGFLVAHLRGLDRAEVSIGGLRGLGEGFWHDYQHLAVARRRRQAAERPVFAFTSANVMIARGRFEQAGGFDERYRAYGFEDRALAFRLEAAGAAAKLAEDALVDHRDALSLAVVCAKMQAAGGANAALFAADFPDAYRQLGYAAIDARLHGWLRLPSALLEPWRTPLIRWLDGCLERRRIPFRWRVAAVRLLVAASYLRGTVAAMSSSRRR